MHQPTRMSITHEAMRGGDLRWRKDCIFSMNCLWDSRACVDPVPPSQGLTGPHRRQAVTDWNKTLRSVPKNWRVRDYAGRQDRRQDHNDLFGAHG